MNGAMPQATPAHRAALALHSLAEADRSWVLQALSGEQQAALQPLLQELQELGIPREAELAQALCDPGEGERDATAGALQALDRAGVRMLAGILAAEPPHLAAALLACRTWPWREALLAALPAPFVREIEHFAPSLSAPAALQAAVQAELEFRLQAQPAPASRWQLLRGRLAQLGAWR